VTLRFVRAAACRKRVQAFLYFTRVMTLDVFALAARCGTLYTATTHCRACYAPLYTCRLLANLLFFLGTIMAL